MLILITILIINLIESDLNYKHDLTKIIENYALKNTSSQNPSIK